MSKIKGSYIVMRKELRLLFKSKRRIFLLFLMPTLVLLGGLIGSAGIYFGEDPIDDPTNIWVIDKSTGEYSNDLLDIWSTINGTKVELIDKDYNDVIKSENFDILILIPNNFSALISNNETAELFISYNANDTSNQFIAFSLFQLTEAHDGILVHERNPNVQFNLINPGIEEISYNDEDVDEGVDEETAQFLVIAPIYMIFFIIISPMTLVLISVTIEREQKTLEMLFLQPVKRRDIMLGKVLYGIVLVFSTLLMYILDIAIIIFMIGAALSSRGDNNEGELTEVLLGDVEIGEALLYVSLFFLAVSVIALIFISLAVLLSLLAKDEKEANLIAGLIPLLIMVMVLVIFVVPIADMGIVGQTLMAIAPVLGIIISIYLSTLAGGIVPLTFIGLIAQGVWAALIILATARISEAESILELTYGKALRELFRVIFRRKKKIID